MKFNRAAVLVIFGVYGIISACSGSQTAATSSPNIASNIPTWFNESGFTSDAVSHTSSATAIASDSVTAVQKASASARNNLEAQIGLRLENVRAELAESGNEDVSKTDFLIILRNAHAQIVDAATISNTDAKSDNGTYRGFVTASISKTALASLLEKGFTGHPRYWATISGSPAFTALVN